RDRYVQITTDEGQDVNPQWTDDGKLYFLSARSGTYNVHSVELTSAGEPGTISAVTNFEDDGIRDYSIAGDGSRLVVERQDQFQAIDLSHGGVTPLEFTLPGDFYSYRNNFISLQKEVTGYAVSPDETFIALEAHGDIFIVRNDKDNPRTNHLIRHAWKDYDPIWNTDSTLMYISDHQGQEDVFQVAPGDTAFTTLYDSYQLDQTTKINTPGSREMQLIISPDHSKVAMVVDYGRLVVYDIDSSGGWKNERTILDGWAQPTDIAWSPDNQWLAYSQPDLDFNREVFIVSADGEGEAVNVSMHPRADRDPVWSRDGSKLAFISNRNNGDDDVWFVWLKKEDWENSKQDWKEKTFEDESKKVQKGDKKKDSIARVNIDFDQIHRRIVQVTSMPGDERNALFGPEGEILYFSGLEGEKTRLFSV